MYRHFAIRLGLLPVLAGFAQAQIASLAIEHYTLPNGFQVITHVDRKAPVVHLNFRIRVGSKHEKPGANGFAHLFEHLMFQGRDASGEFQSSAEKIGATDINGSTDLDYTEFYETVPASRLERILWMESNRFAQFPRNLTQENLDRQRDVVINEKRQKTENEGYGRVDALVNENVWPLGHPYQHNTDGSYSDLRAAKLEDALAFYTEHYTPDQMTLAMVGDLDPAEAKTWVTKYFASMSPSSGPVSPPRSVPPMQFPKVVDLVDRVRVERIWFHWPAPPMASREEAALELAGLMLTDGDRHLYQAVTDKLATGLSIIHEEFQDASLFTVIVSVAPEAGMPDVRAVIDEKIAPGIARLAREGPRPREVDKARNRLESSQTSELESLEGMAGALQLVNQFYGGIDRWNDWASRYSAVTAEDVQKAVAKWIDTPNHLAIHVHPLTARKDSVPEPDRTQPPPFQPDKPYRTPEVQSATLENGLAVFVTERHDLPKVAVEVRFRVGALQNPPGKEGLALLTGAMASKATTNHSADDLESEALRLATTLHGNADYSTQAVGFEVLRKNLDAAFALLADVVRNASFPDAPVEAQKKDWIDSIEKPDEADIGDFTQMAILNAFGKRHPLSQGGLANAATIRSLTPQDARDFHDRYWKPNVAAVVFAGDISLADAVAITRASLGSWTGAAPKPPEMPAPAPEKGQIFLLDRRGATQTMVAQVVPGIPIDSPDYAALFMADRVFGGMSASRLGRNIRQGKGIAYYAASQLSHYPGLGLWVAFSPVQTDQTAVAMREFQQERLALAGGRPITAEELDQARNSVIRALPEYYESLWSTTEQIARTWAWGLPMSALQTIPENLAAVTLEQVNAAARKYAQPERAFFVLIGDREKIEPQIREAGLGEIVAVQ